MLPDRVSNPGPLTYESGALPIALRGPVRKLSACVIVAHLCLFHNFFLHGGTTKLVCKNDHHDKKMCRVQEACRQLESQGLTVHVNVLHGL